jgi:hypothetical protein
MFPLTGSGRTFLPSSRATRHAGIDPGTTGCVAMAPCNTPRPFAFSDESRVGAHRYLHDVLHLLACRRAARSFSRASDCYFCPAAQYDSRRSLRVERSSCLPRLHRTGYGSLAASTIECTVQARTSLRAPHRALRTERGLNQEDMITHGFSVRR